MKSPKLIKQNKPKATPIKSFLYSAPKKVAPKIASLKKATVTEVIAKQIPPKKPALKKLAPKKVSPESSKLNKEPNRLPNKTTNKLANQAAIKEKPAQVTNAVKSDTVSTKNKVAGTNRGNFSSYEQLSRLRNKLANQQRDTAFAELTQKRSVSIMDGEPFPVPETTVPLTQEEEYEKNTSKSHVGSITKNDNGTCTIHREQVLGSPVQATTSSFACGESKFDKSFREHMQKVHVKLGVKKR